MATQGGKKKEKMVEKILKYYHWKIYIVTILAFLKKITIQGNVSVYLTSAFNVNITFKTG